MNKQRKVVITVTYNELGVIVDTKAEELDSSAQPEPHYDEWCTDCKEYDHERHCCPRWNRVIRETLKDAKPEVIRCKDCTKCQIDSVFDEYWCDGRKVSKEHYCGYAERRTDENR